MNILFKYTKNDYIQNTTHFSLLLHTTHFTTQHASCYTYSKCYCSQPLCVANQSVPSYNIYKPLLLQHNLHK